MGNRVLPPIGGSVIVRQAQHPCWNLDLGMGVVAPYVFLTLQNLLSRLLLRGPRVHHCLVLFAQHDIGVRSRYCACCDDVGGPCLDSALRGGTCADRARRRAPASCCSRRRMFSLFLCCRCCLSLCCLILYPVGSIGILFTCDTCVVGDRFAIVSPAICLGCLCVGVDAPIHLSPDTPHLAVARILQYSVLSLV